MTENACKNKIKMELDCKLNHTEEGFMPLETPTTTSIASLKDNPNNFTYLSSRIFSSEEILGSETDPFTSIFSLSRVEALCIDRYTIRGRRDFLSITLRRFASRSFV